MDVKFKKILEGSASEIPEISSKIVRVFISSTFSDMIWERNALMERVYPKIKDYCRDHHGLEFQAVDMRWGVHADAQNDHQASSLCLQEIRNCQQLSVGPDFVILMGQKYGSRPFPSSIVQTEFETLLSALDETEESSNLELLKTWFKLDENCVPAKYLLQPISSILTHYNDQDSDKSSVDQQKWSEVYKRLTETLRKAATICFDHGKINKVSRDNYFISVTENEIRTGVLSCPELAGKKCLCFVREIEDIRENLKHPKCYKYIDIQSDGGTDQEAGQLLKTLKEEKIASVLPTENTHHYTVTWDKERGIDPQTHAAYLDEFCKDFYSSMVRLIHKCVTEAKQQQDTLVTEVVQHVKMSQTWTNVFHGREDVLSRLSQYICSSNRHPFVIHGPSGSGKSAVLARLFQLTRTWITQKESLIMIRFLGITPKSSGIRPVLESLCLQICLLLRRNPASIPTDHAQLITYFHELLQGASSRRPIVIFLDSLDQLSPNNFSFRLAWLPKVLPVNVKLVLSTLPDMYGILENLKVFLPEENFLELCPLGDELSQETLLDRLLLVNRAVTEKQLDIVHDVFRVCSLPLFTKVMFEEICAWKSYTEIKADAISSSIESAIDTMLERLEIEHGKILVSHALAYLTASQNGLTLVELEDILSLDDVVLNSVFTFWLPPIRRIPPAILTRLKIELQGYVVDRESDGVPVIYWYHRKFIEVAKKRYLSNEGFAENIHSLLSDYFNGTWGGGKLKPFIYSAFLAARLNLKETSSAADRKVPLQPLNFYHNEGEATSFNMRKLRELPEQLVASKRYADLKSLIAFNYDWYIAKIKAFSLQDLLADLSLAASVLPEETSLKQVIDVLRLSASTLNSNPDCLSLELAGRLLDFYDSDMNIKSLIDACDQSTECFLTVPYQCFDGPTKSLLFSLEGHSKSIVDVAFLNNKEMVTFGWDGMLCFWDLSSGELLKQVDASFVEPNLRAFLLPSKDCTYLVALNKVEASYLGIYIGETGDLLHKYKHTHSQHFHRISIGIKYLCVDFAVLVLETGKVMHRLDKYNVNINQYTLTTFASDDKSILFAGPSETALYDIASCEKIFSVDQEQTASHTMLTPDGRFAFVGYCMTCFIKVVDTEVGSKTYGKEILEIDIPSMFPEVGIAEDKKDLFCQEVSDMRLSPNGQFVLALLKRFYIAVWNINKLDLKAVLLQNSTVPETTFRSLSYYFSPTFTPDSKHVVAYRLDGTLLIWEIETGQFLTQVAAHSNEIMHLAVNQECNLMATVAKGDLTIKVWDIKSMVTQPGDAESKKKVSCVRSVLIPDDCDMVICHHSVANYSRRVYQMMDHFGLDLLNLKTNKKTCILPFGQFGHVSQLHCSSNGEVLLLGMANLPQRRLRVVDLKESKLLFTCTQPFCVKAGLSKNGKFLASVTNNEDKYLTTLRTVEGGIILELFENCCDFTFLPDSSTVVLLSVSGMLTIHSMATGEKSQLTVRNSPEKLISIGGELADKILVITSLGKKKDRLGTVVDVQKGKELGSLSGISQNGLEDFTTDGKFCIDSDLQIFDLVSVKKFKQIQLGCKAVKNQLKFLCRGKYVVWIDAAVTDLLKVCLVETDQIVACCNLHGTPLCLAVSSHSDSIVVGTNDGDLIVLHVKPIINSDDNQVHAYYNRSKLVKNCSTTLDVSQVSKALQEELEDLAKQARLFTFSVTTLEKSDQEGKTSTCVLT